MLSRPMPFRPVPCSIWVPTYGEPDAYGNVYPTFTTEPTVSTTCCYAPGQARNDTYDDIEQGAPYGARLVMIFFLPKTVTADLRGARIACHPSDDATLSAKVFDVVGEPYSYSRDNTPGDYSWYVEGVLHDG